MRMYHPLLSLRDHYQRRVPVARLLNILSSTGSNFDNYGTTSHRRRRPVHKLRISPVFLTAEKDTPKLSWRPVYLAWFVLHFLLILIVCTRDTFSLLAEGTVRVRTLFTRFGKRLTHLLPLLSAISCQPLIPSVRQ